MSLTHKQSAAARNKAVAAAQVAFKHSSAINYTEGAERWQGISTKRVAARGQFPTEADCSAYVTWCYWNALKDTDLGDVVNGAHWTGGYTGTMLAHGHPVAVADVRRADAIIYGTPGSTGAHTAIAVTPGPNPMVLSHGSPGVHLLHYNYRPDIIGFRRYIPFVPAPAKHKPEEHKPQEHKPEEHKPEPTHKPTVMFDSITLSEIPSGAEAVAGYVGGNWPTFHELGAKWPHARHLSIAVNAGEHARCLDIESGDAVADQAPGWFHNQADHSSGKPVLYTSAGNINAVVAAMTRAGIGRDKYLLWSAHYNGRQHICGSCGYPKADATQWTDRAMGRNLDQSEVSPGFWD